jgi:hypothetical protein
MPFAEGGPQQLAREGGGHGGVDDLKSWSRPGVWCVIWGANFAESTTCFMTGAIALHSAIAGRARQPILLERR